MKQYELYVRDRTVCGDEEGPESENWIPGHAVRAVLADSLEEAADELERLYPEPRYEVVRDDWFVRDIEGCTDDCGPEDDSPEVEEHLWQALTRRGK